MSKKNEKKQAPAKGRVKAAPAKKITPPFDIPLWVVIAVFIVTTLIFFWGNLFGDYYFWEDFVEYVYPTQSFAASSHGLAFWNPFTFNGMPFFADIQVGFYYPFNRLLDFFVSDEGILPVAAAQFIIILHFLIAQISMYMLLRYWKVSKPGAMLGAVSYAFSMIMVCHVIHPMMIYHLAFLPMVIKFFLEGLDNSKLICGIISGLILGMTMLAGHPQTTLYEFMLLGLIFIWYFIADIKKGEFKEKPISKFLIGGILTFIVAAGIFAVQLLPTQELAGYSQREEITYDKATEGSLQFKQIYTSVVPKIFGYTDGLHSGANQPDAPYYLYRQQHFYWETSFYFGVAALILGLLGAVVYIKKREAALMVVVALLAFFFAMGKNFFIFDIFYNLPLIGTFRNPARMMALAVLAISVLAGFGFDALWKEGREKKIPMKLLIVAAVPALIALLTASGTIPAGIGTPEQIMPVIKSFGTTAFILIILLLILSFLLNKNKLNSTVAGAFIVILAFVDLKIAGGTFNESPEKPSDTYRIDPNLHMSIETLKPHLPDNIFRTSMRLYNPPYMAMARNQGMIDRIMLVEGYNPLVLARAIPPVNKNLNAQQARQQIHDLYNVKYEIDMNPQTRYPMFVERNTYYPRAWFVNDAIVTNVDNVKKVMENQVIDYKAKAVLEEDPGVSLSSGSGTSNASVKCTEYTNNVVKYEVNTDKDGILCFSEVWYPAWKAFVDGEQAKLLRADYCFRAVPVKAGKHEVVMSFESSAYSTGSIITLVTLLLSAAGIVILFIRRKKT